MKILILEDDPHRNKWFGDNIKHLYPNYDIFWAEDVETAKRQWDNHNPFDIYFLDHDLGGEIYVPSEDPNTGFQFAKFLVINNVLGNNEEIIIHSYNPTGAMNMHHCFQVAHRIPFLNGPFWDQFKKVELS